MHGETSQLMTSKVTSDGQVTIPIEIRERLHVSAGDSIVYEVEGDAVRVRKLEPLHSSWHGALSSTLEEWDSPEDDEAFSGL